jgi:putative heme iron utilization protein
MMLSVNNWNNHKEARALLLESRAGVLSTHSAEVPGYPFGSVTPYCLDREGRPVLLISTIAQHTKNIQVDPRVALTVLAAGATDVQAAGRLTYLADAARLADDETGVAERYYRYFPASRGYHGTHDFSFYVLEPVRLRYIGGFGNIRWIAPQEILEANPFNARAEQAILDHMNEDHGDALRHYCRSGHGVDPKPEDDVAMVGIDGEGFDVRIGEHVHRLSFDHPVTNAGEAREALVAMAR